MLFRKGCCLITCLYSNNRRIVTVNGCNRCIILFLRMNLLLICIVLLFYSFFCVIGYFLGLICILRPGALLIPFETLLYPVCLCLYPLLVKQLFPSVLPLLQVSVSPDSERSVLWFLPELVLPDLTLLD